MPEQHRKWVTREKAKVDRIACPRLIKNFVDSDPEFLFVPADKVLSTFMSRFNQTSDAAK